MVKAATAGNIPVVAAFVVVGLAVAVLVFLLDVGEDVAFHHPVALVGTNLGDASVKVGKHFLMFAPEGSDVAEVVALLVLFADDGCSGGVNDIDFPDDLPADGSFDGGVLGTFHLEYVLGVETLLGEFRFLGLLQVGLETLLGDT